MSNQRMYKAGLIYQACINLSMGQFALVNPKIIRKDLNKERKMIILQFEEGKLIHEHEFIPKKLKGRNHFDTCCLTCGACYCNMCGRII